MIDQLLIDNTLQKINESLNKRFEKNADLYISRQEEHELKKHICNNEFLVILDMMKGRNISSEIVLKVLIRNAGVIDIPNINKFEKEFSSVLNNVNYRSISYIMEDVLYNNIYVQDDLRVLLIKYFMNGISYEERIKYWNNNDYMFTRDEREIVFKSIILNTDYNADIIEKCDFIRDSLEKYPNLLNERDLLLKLKEISNKEDKLKLFKYIRDEIGNPSIQDELYTHMLTDAFVTYEKKAFNSSLEKIKEKNGKNYKLYIRVISKILSSETDEKKAGELFDSLYKVYNSNGIDRNIKNRIYMKVWVILYGTNKVVYKERKNELDELCKNLGKSKKKSKQYKSYEDIYVDIKNDKISYKNIAFKWLNLVIKNKNDFITSIKNSFDITSETYYNKIKDTYEWLFIHSKAKGGEKDLILICNYMSEAICSYGNVSNGCAKIADEILIKYLKKHRINGKNIDSYLTTYHFKEYQILLKNN